MSVMKSQSTISWNKLGMPCLVAFALLYFAFHLVNGDRGVYALFKETQRQKLLTSELAEVSAKREAMEIKVSHLRNDSLDLDLLDEQARRMLGLMGEGEKMILLESQN